MGGNRNWNDSATLSDMGISSSGQHNISGSKKGSTGRGTFPPKTARRESKSSFTASLWGNGSLGGSDPVSQLGSKKTNKPSAMIGTTRSIQKIHRRVWVGRVGFVCCLATVAAALGAAAFGLSKTTEIEFAESQFESIADRALTGAHDVAKRKRFTLMTMADIISNEFSSELWPFVHIQGYERIVSHLVRSGSHKTMGFAPFVSLDLKSEWEDFAYSCLDQKDDFASGDGIDSDLGEGIWKLDDDLGTRIPDTLEKHVFAPVFQIDSGPDKDILLYNLHSEEHRRNAIDAMIHYHHGRNKTLMADHSHHMDHQMGGVLTDIVQVVRYKAQGPASIMMHPIFPVDSPGKVKGLVFSLVVWDELFENLFNKDVQGVHCVLKSDTQVHTYTISNGLVESFEAKDIHHKKYESLGRHIDLTPEELNPIGTRYKLFLYPTDDFFHVYYTDNPRNSALIAATVIALTASCFLLYDSFVRKETQERIQILEAKRRFIRYVSHEVRTPLNAVCMGLTAIHTELLESTKFSRGGGSDNHHQKKAAECMNLLEEVQAGARSAVDVLNAVLQYDKIEQSTLALEINMVPIFDLVERTIGEFKLSAGQKQVHLKVVYQLSEDAEQPISCANDLPDEVQNLRVAGDSARLAQVLRNLFSNALKFTPCGNHIVVQTTYVPTASAAMPTSESIGTVMLQDGKEVFVEPKGTVVFAVEDSGAGMTKEQLGCLFGEFVQFNVNELQGGKGSGLGLFITKGIVEQHKGSLVATSRGLGKGSTFTMTLPIFSVPNFEDSAEEEEVTLEGGIKTMEEECLETLKILVVDDALSNRKLLSRLLTMKGHHCDMAENGKIAVEKVREAMVSGELYDAVLCDFEMPVMDGPTAAREIREMGSDVFLVGITGNMLQEDVEYFKSQGAHIVLPKPLQMPLLEETFMEHGILGTTQKTHRAVECAPSTSTIETLPADESMPIAPAFPSNNAYDAYIDC